MKENNGVEYIMEMTNLHFCLLTNLPYPICLSFLAFWHGWMEDRTFKKNSVNTTVVGAIFPGNYDRLYSMNISE